MEKERINKYIASCTEVSRREADKLILAGKVKINGQKITELGLMVSAKDKVELDGKILAKQKFEYLKKEYGASYVVRNKNDLKGRAVVTEMPNGIGDYELIYENKDFELRRLKSAEE